MSNFPQWSDGDDDIIVALARQHQRFPAIAAALPHRGPYALRERIRALSRAGQLTAAQATTAATGAPVRPRADRPRPEREGPTMVVSAPADPVRVARFWLRVGADEAAIGAELRAQCPREDGWPEAAVRAVIVRARG